MRLLCSRNAIIACWSALLAQIEFLQRQLAKHVRIADAALHKLDDFLGDKSCRRIINNFQMQRFAGPHKSSGHVLDDFRVKGLSGKKWSDRYETCSSLTSKSSTALFAAGGVSKAAAGN